LNIHLQLVFESLARLVDIDEASINPEIYKNKIESKCVVLTIKRYLRNNFYLLNKRASVTGKTNFNEINKVMLVSDAITLASRLHFLACSTSL
jgi:hypothetical protein